MSETLLEILKFTVPALTVFLITYLVLKAFLNKEYKIRQIEFKFANQKDALPIRLQAYERLTLFLERVELNNLLHRVRVDGMTVRDFQVALLSNIRSEYQHNVTQQIYVTPQLWGTIKGIKEEIISIVNQRAQEIPPQAPASALSKAVLAFLIESEHPLPTLKALEMIRKEVMEIY